MHILYLVPYAPNLVRVRPYNLIRQLNRRGHRITLLTLTMDETECAGLKKLMGEGVQVKAFPLSRWQALLNSLRALPGGDPLQSYFCWQPQLAGTFLSLVQNSTVGEHVDVIQIEHMRGVQYGIWIKERLGNNLPPIIWDSVDNISYLFRQASHQSNNLTTRIVARLELERSSRLEARMVGFFSRTLVTSSVDRAAFVKLAPEREETNISVVPNGVDLEYFQPEPGLQRDPATLVVSGKMSYHANVTMVLKLVKDILPLVWERRPEVKLLVVGKDPPESVRRLSKDPRIQVTGMVADIRPYIRQATLAVAPIPYGAGIQNKVLEAMACGTPVIATSQAVQALSAKHGQELVVANTPQEFARSVLDLLGDPDRQTALGLAGLDYVRTYHNWDKIAANLEIIFDQVKIQQSAIYNS